MFHNLGVNVLADILAVNSCESRNVLTTAVPNEHGVIRSIALLLGVVINVLAVNINILTSFAISTGWLPCNPLT